MNHHEFLAYTYMADRQREADERFSRRTRAVRDG